MSKWKTVSKRKARMYYPEFADAIDKGWISVQVKEIHSWPVKKGAV